MVEVIGRTTYLFYVISAGSLSSVHVDRILGEYKTKSVNVSSIRFIKFGKRMTEKNMGESRMIENY